ncbi:MAG TPA: hypothetical protein VES93_10725 [Ornithinibacter sp.]|nr:hypothetical protein [Ornithinibacter sp.]
MTRNVAVAVADVRTLRAHSPAGSFTDAPGAVHRPALTPRSARVLVQVGVLGVLAAAPLVPVSVSTALLLGQVAAAVMVSLVVRALRPGHSPTARTLAIWGVGAAVSLIAVTWLHGIHGMDVPRAQLGAVLALLGLAVLGRMGDAYRAAGTQLDAILATLPPPTQDPERLSR